MRDARKDRKYSVTDVKMPTYKRDPNRLEGYISPLGTVKIGEDTDIIKRELTSFENQINRRFSQNPERSPTITFNATETFEETMQLS